MTKRLLWADLIRSLSIYFVVVIHNSIVPEKFSLIGLLPATIFMIVKTSIPMFVMLSGALLLGKKENYVIFFKKRFVKVFFPWLIWTFIYMAWNYNFHHYQPHTPSQWKYFFELTFFSQLWFLPLIAGIYLLTPIFRIIIQSGRLVDRYYYIILWFLLVLFFPYIHPSLAFPFDPSGFFQQAILYSGYFIIGYLIIDKTPSRLSRKYLTVLYSLFIICILWTLFDYFFTSKSMQAYNYIAPNIALGSIVLFVILFQLFRNYKTNISSPLILNISKASLGIYLIHQIVIEISYSFLLPVTKMLFNINPALVGISLGAIYFIISFVIIYFLQKIPLLEKIIP